VAAKLNGKGLRAGIAVSRFNGMITERLRAGAVSALVAHGVREADIEVVEVSGAFELPQALKMMTLGKRKPDLMVAIGAIMEGETVHHEVLAKSVIAALEQVALETGIPTGLGVLTPKTVEQGLERSGGKMGNKGEDGALAALELACRKRDL
jgi:6,7-dimethyl-8-ribityllumazine synthase